MRRVALAASILTLILAMLACGGDEDEQSRSGTPTQTGVNGLGTPIVTAEPTPETQTATPEPTAVPNVCETNPDPATPDVVQVDAPEPFTRISSPVTVAGRIAAFEARFKIRIFDAAGGIAGGITAMSAEGQVLSPFSADVDFAVVAETAGCIWVYEESPMDGSPIHVAQIPVVLLTQ
jgi:hypothetical protein